MELFTQPPPPLGQGVGQKYLGRTRVKSTKPFIYQRLVQDEKQRKVSVSYFLNSFFRKYTNRGTFLGHPVEDAVTQVVT